MLKKDNTQPEVRPTTQIGEALEQLADHRMSANPIAVVQMPDPDRIHQVTRSGDRFGFPVEFAS